MTTKEITKTVTSTIYIANDDTEFTDKYSCRVHDWRLVNKPVYIVYRRGQRTEVSRIFSSRLLAEDHTNGSYDFTVAEIYVDFNPTSFDD